MTEGSQAEPSGCLRVVFAGETLGWAVCSFFSGGFLITLLISPPEHGPPLLFTAGVEGVALALSLVLAGLALHAAIRGGGVLTRKMDGGGVPVAVCLSLLRGLLLGTLVVALMFLGLGVTR